MNNDDDYDYDPIRFWFLIVNDKYRIGFKAMNGEWKIEKKENFYN